MKTAMFAVETGPDGADSLAEALSELAECEITRAQKSSLDGSPSTVLQIVQIVSSLAAAVTPLFAAYLESRRVKKIKIGSIEIENPTREQWEKLWGDYLRRQDGDLEEGGD